MGWIKLDYIMGTSVKLEIVAPELPHIVNAVYNKLKDIINELSDELSAASTPAFVVVVSRLPSGEPATAIKYRYHVEVRVGKNVLRTAREIFGALGLPENYEKTLWREYKKEHPDAVYWGTGYYPNPYIDEPGLAYYDEAFAQFVAHKIKQLAEARGYKATVLTIYDP